MDLPREKNEKLSRYFINADPFLWGVLASKNKKGRIKELKQMGYLANYADGGNPIYSKINRDLLVELGIVGILKKIVIPRIVMIFSPQDFRYLRDCWNQGLNPDMEYLNKNKLYRSRVPTKNDTHSNGYPECSVLSYRDPAFIFVQIDTQHNFVERWTIFAGLWFEEMNDLVAQASSENFEGLLNPVKKMVVVEKEQKARNI